MSYRVLVADDQDSARVAVHATLQSAGFQVECARDGLQAWAALGREDAPEIAVLDWNMPGLDGVDLCRRVRAHHGTRYTYMLLVSARGEQADITHGLSAGADDYVVKPFDLEELIERVRAGARVVDRELRLQEAHAQLRVEHERRSAELEALSVTDELTNLYNRRGFVTLAEQHARVAVRRQQSFAIVFVDVNGLKVINDHLGHEVGDQALCEAAAVLRRSMRNGDIVARLGGDEFVALLDDCDADGIELVFTRLNRELEALAAARSTPYRLSLSAGAAFFDAERPQTIDELLVAADQRMYARKRARRTLSAPVLKTPPGVRLEPRSGGTSPSSRSSWPRSPEPWIELSRPADEFSGLGDHLRYAWNLRRADGGAHARRLVAYTQILARTLGGLDREIDALGQLALLHDIGELALSDAILTSGGGLSVEDRALQQRHTVFGAELLSGVKHPFYQLAAKVARHHHECWDGSGHPDGLTGAVCPFEARFVGIIDAYDLLRHPADGADGWTDERIADYLRRERARRFDPELVDGVVRALEELRAANDGPSPP